MSEKTSPSREGGGASTNPEASKDFSQGRVAREALLSPRPQGVVYCACVMLPPFLFPFFLFFSIFLSPCSCAFVLLSFFNFPPSSSSSPSSPFVPSHDRHALARFFLVMPFHPKLFSAFSCKIHHHLLDNRPSSSSSSPSLLFVPSHDRHALARFFCGNAFSP